MSSPRSRAGVRPIRLAALILPLALALSMAGWASADSASPTWHVRDLTQRSSARVRLVGAWFMRGSGDDELARAAALCKEFGQSDCAAPQFAAETPERRVYVRSFEIDRFEVSAGEYQRCVGAGRCLPPRPSEPELRPEQPVVQVTWREARDYCRFVGGDLPTEAQWEYAAHGDSRRSFPWGDDFRPELAGAAGPQAELRAATAYAEGRSFFGLLNMAGNVWELVLDRYIAPYADEMHSVDPVQLAAGAERVMRGGSFRAPPHMLRTRYRAAIAETEARSDVGFRCAYAAGRP